ncbi:helix-turn-helix transcriptional regulator [Cystobacter ferrugineus]|uniref:Transcriptional regulator n=1 Tax=Cystobacter ferrugineus TaxID=83449 RepID=A0A1L9B5D0_9BACT|nr:YafY family protein [Cystobacter ferrugineus]OJH37469.1 transcriptional regulator [Cystobacter ferrugineus]
MRASRLLSILMLLQTRGRMTAEALAAEFEVSVRTIYRDIDELSAAGAPVYADRGRSGGFALLDGYHTRLTGLTDAEAETLFLGGVAGPAAQLGLREAMAASQLKLLAALPPERQAAAARIASRFHLDPVAWFREPENAERLPAIAQAVWSSHRLSIRYGGWKGEVVREVEPLGLVLKAGAWYLAASVGGGEPRVYRVENILDMTVLEAGFDRPADFDLEAFWQAFSSRFETDIYTGEATLRVTQAGLKRLSYLGAATAAAVRGKTAGEGWIEVTVPIESVAHASVDFLRLGAEAEVLSPPELRDALAATVRRLVGTYGA